MPKFEGQELIKPSLGSWEKPRGSRRDIALDNRSKTAVTSSPGYIEIIRS